MNSHLEALNKRDLYRTFAYGPMEGVVFVLAPNRDDASRKIRNTLAILHNVPPYQVEFDTPSSYDELVKAGVSADEELRIFETARAGDKVVSWAIAPLFLTNDRALLGKWAELYAGMATQEARDLIQRAR
jgi:hypothetical protein